MKLRMRRCGRHEDLGGTSYDLGIVGPALDDRGRLATEYVRQNVGKCIEVSYDPEEMKMIFDGERVEADELSPLLIETGSASLVLEATTMGLPELCLFCRAAREAHLGHISFIYVEPGGYLAPNHSNSVHRRDFELSSEIHGFVGVPGMGLLLDEAREQHVVFFVGYEGQRLDRAFENLSLVPKRCSVTFGVPAFRPGWEMDTYANIVPVMRERKVEGGVFFCGADNPAAALDLLEQRYRAKGTADELFVAPLGTKPHGIGVSLFLSEHDDVGLLYDHPRGKLDRTHSSLKWHQFYASWD